MYLSIRQFHEALRRFLFNRKYGLGAYDTVYGADLRAFLDQEYGQERWSWVVKLNKVDRANSVFEVRYDDCGAWAGLVAVAPHRAPAGRYRIIKREEREWPPPEPPRDWS
jgi:hypothetical protein